jgi:hypothetical protein
MKSMTTDKTDLETRLVALRDSLGRVVTRDEVEPCLYGFDAAAAIARDVIAKKDAEITKLRNLVELRHSKQCENDECDLCEAVFS